MSRLVKFPFDEGASVLDEVDGAPGEPVIRGPGKDRSAFVEVADKTLEDAIEAVTPAARSLLIRLRPIDNPPDEVGIQFGVQLSAQTGRVIALVAGQGNLTMSMIWRRHGAAGG